jgi:hypothetical protein
MALSKIQNNSYADTAVHGRRNLIINGAMQVAQRGTSFSSVTTGAYHLDRFKTILSGLGTWTMSQSTTAPSGFSTSLKYECTTADASPAAGDYMALYHNLEGQNIQHLKKGTASAESLTLSFWVRSNKTGTYQVNLYDDDNNRVLGSTYSISSADTWEYKTITYSGDTTGSLDNDNALSLHVEWWLGSGTNFSSGTIPSSWEALDNTDRNASGTVNLADTIGNTFYITGVQLEVGNAATPFEHRSCGEELALCERYYQIASPLAGHGHSTSVKTSISFKTAMRSQPTLSFTSNSYDVTDGYLSNYASTNANPSWQYYVDSGGGVVNTSNHPSIAGDTRQNTMLMNSAQKLFMDAEL